jgi:excinuclease ABC subunit C
MQDAKGDVLYVGKARALKNRVTTTPRSPTAQAVAADGRQTRSMTIVTTDRGRGAVARGAADQALPAALQRPAARRQKLPFILLREDHPFPQVRKHRGARRAKGQYFGRSQAPDRSPALLTRCRSFLAKKLFGQLFR